MNREVRPSEGLFRVWIGRSPDWRPRHWTDVPREIVLLELADDRCFSRGEVAAFLEGFNSQMLEGDDRYWAVALPVSLCDEADWLAEGFVVGDKLAAWCSPVA
jgi:hypothetical protein